MEIIQIVGYKNAGKTTLVCALVDALVRKAYKVGTLKRDAHDIDPEPPDTDTRRHRQAGAIVSAFSSSSRTAWVEERPTSVDRLVAEMERQALDVLVIEGFKTAPYPKVVLVRSEQETELLALPGVIAVVCRMALPGIGEAAKVRRLPVFVLPDAHDYGPLLELLLDRLQRIV